MDTKTEIKDSIVFYKSWHEAFRAALDDHQYVLAMDVMMNYYAIGEMQKTGDALVDAMVSMAKYSLDENKRRYENGKKGGRPRKSAAQQGGEQK